MTGPVSPLLMDKIQQLRDKLANVSIADQENALLEIIRTNQNYIVDLNTGQLLKGVDADFLPLHPQYKSKSYATFKLFLNPLGVVDLRLTGAFYAGFFINADKFPVEFNSSDGKTGVLAEKYGAAIFGLDQPSKDDLVEHIKTQIQTYYKNLLVV